MRSIHRATTEEGRRGSDAAPASPEPRFIAIGRITRPYGIRGEVAVEVLTDFPERFDSIEVVYLGDALEAQAWQVTATRWHKDRVLLTLQSCEDRTAAERLRGLLVQVPIEEAMPLPEDEYYTYELIGLDVVTVEGEDLGRVSDVLFTSANDVYVVVGPRGQILLPAIADVIERIDLDAGQMVVRLMEGLVADSG
jgi:16S rRNA processing protein RimM